jgi:MSHA biogenesis protein MshG
VPHFAYKARDGRGALLEGVLESTDPGAAASQLMSRGITPVEVLPARPPSVSMFSIAGMNRRSQRVSDVELMLFSRQMHTLLKSGVPIMRGLTGLQESTGNKRFAAVILDVRQALDAGTELSGAFARHPRVFSLFFIHMVRVGEMTGRLDEIFLSLFHHLEFEKFMREQVKAALRYPAFVVIAMIAAVVVINLFVIPAFANVYKSFNAQLPFLTQVLIGFSSFMVKAWPAMLLALFAAIAGFRAWTRRPAGRVLWDAIKLRIPIAGEIALKGTLSRFARSFALAARSGVPIVQALTTVARTVDNAYIARKIEEMRGSVERGESVLRTATTAGVFTPMVLQMIAVGEESGSLDEMMQEVADLYRREVEYALKNLSAQIEPLLIVAMGVVVLVLALGVFLPIWDLGRAMK